MAKIGIKHPIGTTSGGTITGASNVGGGAEVFQEDNAGTLEFRTITSDNGIGVNQGADEINLSFSFPSADAWSEANIDPNDPFLVYSTASGEHEQLTYGYLVSQLNDDLSVSDVEYDAENKDAGTISAGMIVAAHSSGSGVIKAIATSTATRGVGFAINTVAPTFTNTVRTGGVITIANWTAIAGTATLSANAVYFLDPLAAGMITTVAPTTTGQIVQRVGMALSPTTLGIEIEQPIKL